MVLDVQALEAQEPPELEADVPYLDPTDRVIESAIKPWDGVERRDPKTQGWWLTSVLSRERRKPLPLQPAPAKAS